MATKYLKIKIEVKKVKIVTIAFFVLTIFAANLYDLKVAYDQDFLKAIGIKYNSPKDGTIAEEFQTSSAQKIANVVIPQEGYTVNIRWGDVGKKLIQSGAIDMSKFEQNYSSEEYEQLLKYLTEEKNEGITINQKNAHFWVNTLWALGLTQKSDVLSKGVMGTKYKDKIGNFASTGGWTLGSKDAVKLFSSTEIIKLTEEQNKRVFEISENIFRPCCGNSAAFPDCNHGMAILGLVELMVSQGFNDKEVYKAALYFNSYWFPQTYIDLAYYFETKENLKWTDVDPRKALSAQFSSSQGYLNIKKQIGDSPKLQSSGGGCGV